MTMIGFQNIAVTAQEAEPESLNLGVPVENQIGVGETHTYQINLTNGEFEISLVFTNSTADLDLLLYDGNGTKINESVGVSQVEYIKWTNLKIGTFTIKVVAVKGSSYYTLEVSEYKGLQLNTPLQSNINDGEELTYSINLSPGVYDVKLTFNGEADLDLYVNDEDGISLAYSESSSNYESVRFEILSEQEVTISVYSYYGSTGFELIIVEYIIKEIYLNQPIEDVVFLDISYRILLSTGLYHVQAITESEDEDPDVYVYNENDTLDALGTKAGDTEDVLIVVDKLQNYTITVENYYAYDSYDADPINFTLSVVETNPEFRYNHSNFIHDNGDDKWNNGEFVAFLDITIKQDETLYVVLRADNPHIPIVMVLFDGDNVEDINNIAYESVYGFSLTNENGVGTLVYTPDFDLTTNFLIFYYYDNYVLPQSGSSSFTINMSHEPIEVNKEAHGVVGGYLDQDDSDVPATSLLMPISSIFVLIATIRISNRKFDR